MWPFPSTAKRTHSSRHGRSGVRPQIEVLEDRCLLSGGVLDPTFGSAGVVTTAIGADAVAAAVAVYPNAGTANDSKIVAAGNITRPNSNLYESALARYNTTGSLDTSFGSAGTATTALGQENTIQAIAIQPDGKVLAAGWVLQSHNYDFALTRYTTSGGLDTSFGTKGVVTTNFTGGGKSMSADFASAIVLQSDGKILVAGTTTTGSVPGNNNIALARYNSNGSFDTSFGSGGKVITSYTSLPGSVGYTTADAVALEPDGTIVVFGASRFAGSVNHPFVIRYTTSGVLDNTFGSTGIVVLTQVSVAKSGGIGNPPKAAGVVQGDGRVVVEGTDATSTSPDLARLNLDGSLDSTFGMGGIAYEQGFGGTGFALQSDGKFVLGAGNAIVRLLSSGAVDTTFGTNGLSAAVPVSSFNSEESVAIQPNGEIVLASAASVSGTQDFVLARFLATGPQIGSFTASPNPATAGSSVTLTAANVVALNPGSTVTQVAFYQDSNGDGVLEPGTDTLLGSATQTSPATWSFTFTVNLTPGTYTLFAQAEDNDGVFSDPLALTFAVM
jgi:uncharacterized delta-60 repeat protein